LNKYLKELVELSKIDKSIDSFRPKIEAIEQGIEKIQAKADNTASKMQELQASVDDSKAKMASYEEQITSLNDQLISIQKKNKDVTNEKEMKALSLEEELAKEKLTYANEEIERLSKVAQAKQDELSEAEESLKGLESEIATATEESKTELAQIEKEKTELYKDREKATAASDQKILELYEKIRKWAHNTAVVPVKNQACYGCYMKINDKAYSDVIKGDEIVCCPHCARIIYLDTQEAETEA